MSTPNLLITGVTGYIGFKILLDALREGYSVRAAIRTLDRSEVLLSNPNIKALSPGERLSFIEVPDITKVDAYDEAIKGVTYAIHVASPLPLPLRDPETDIIQPTVNGAANILAAALMTPSVKRVVITSSIVANMPFPPTADVEITEKSRVPELAGPTTEVFPAYCAAKIAALNAADQFVKENSPSFNIINIFPGFVYGQNDKATDVKGLHSSSNRLLIGILLGQSFEAPRLAGAAHIDDVSKVHLLALNEKIKGNQDFGVTAPMVYDSTFEIVKKHFPKAVEDGIFSQGHVPSLKINWNASKTEEVFQFKFKTFEEMVVDAAGQYLDLWATENS